MATRRFHSEALRYAYDELIGKDPERQASFEQEVVNVEAAQLIHEMRAKAGISQRELARIVGTTASVICRMEDAAYEGHTLAMLRRIAEAMNRRIELRAVPIKPRRSAKVHAP